MRADIHTHTPLHVTLSKLCVCVCLIPWPKQWDEGPGGVKGAALTSFIFQLFILSVVSCSFVNSKNRAQKPQPPHRIGMRVSGF